MMLMQFTQCWNSSEKKKEIFTFKQEMPDELAIHILLQINPALQVLKTERRDEDEDQLAHLKEDEE